MANEIADAVQATVGRVLTDPNYAEQLRADGLAAVRAGAGSEAWENYFNHFAPTPGALAGLAREGMSAADCTCNSNTVITLSTLVSPIPTCCGATTTTTTSGS